MLKFINRMNSIHWLLLLIAVYTLFSVGKLAVGVGVLIAVVAVMVRFRNGVIKVFTKLFNNVKINVALDKGDLQSSAKADKEGE